MSRKPGTSDPGLIPAYRAVLIRPNRWPVAWASRAISADHSGATALVPPTTWELPSDMIWYPVVGSALPATSGTPRPPPEEPPAPPDPDPDPDPDPPVPPEPPDPPEPPVPPPPPPVG